MLKLPLFDPTITLHHEWSQDPPYVTSRPTQIPPPPLSFISLFWNQKNNSCTPTYVIRSFSFQALGMNLSLSLDVLKRFLILTILESTLIRQLDHFEAKIFSYKHQQALNIAVTILHNVKTPWLRKYTWQNILKFQNVNLERILYSSIRILNQNIWIWD